MLRPRRRRLGPRALHGPVARRRAAAARLDGRSGSGSRRRVFVLLRDSSLRRGSLAARQAPRSATALYGADQLAERGFAVRHSLEPGSRPASAPPADRALRLGVRRRRRLRWRLRDRARVRRERTRPTSFSRPSTPSGSRRRCSGGPASCAGRSSTQASGCSDRVERLRNRAAHRGSTGARSAASARRRRLRPRGGRGAARLAREATVRFLPFGVDTDCVRAAATRRGRCRRRSRRQRPAARLSTLAAVAAPPERFVRGGRLARSGEDPRPRAVEVDGLDRTSRLRRSATASRGRASSRFRCARTSTRARRPTLLQAMAHGKPVVVSRTAAIAEGYGLEDGENCRLVPPGDGRRSRTRSRAARRRAAASVMGGEGPEHGRGVLLGAFRGRTRTDPPGSGLSWRRAATCSAGRGLPAEAQTRPRDDAARVEAVLRVRGLERNWWLGRRRSSARSTSGSTRRSSHETRPDLIVETGTSAAGARSTSPRSATARQRAGRDHRHRPNSEGVPPHPRSLTWAHAPSTDPRWSPRCAGGRGQDRPPDPRLGPLQNYVHAEIAPSPTSSRRLLPDRRGLQHRPRPQGPHARPARGDRDLRGPQGRVRDRPGMRERFMITFNPGGFLRRVS